MSILATIEALHRELDAHPDAHDTRLILADALEDSGDPELASLAPGYRALGVLRKRPQVVPRGGAERPWGFTWTTDWNHPRYKLVARCIPGDWFHFAWPHGHVNTEASRRAAEDAAATAFAQLPAERRADLLRTEVAS